MTVRHRVKRTLLAATMGLTLATAGLASASSAQASSTGTTKISCSAVKVRKTPAKNATAYGVAYRGDKIVYDQFAYKKSEKTWYTRGWVTRKSDGAKIHKGYVFYKCANPYGTNPAPTPPIPK